ncbi:DNA-binding response regulator, OmpR family, contains REC and winged-helix (wHTH) domain [Thermoactinomyces sp. DSM 45891]|uniref:response regulator transcription factor n=1 Tax=Thermoactinomyces sp. DSM 45891 TaxID=1761907 RepID=UPI00091A4A1B|nr:response regulator transcription factor [Thermoactinomyces sp. DSM 45891]SFX31622.1 DNA-binding response regulator, OmpR family, contains REC and winged-helix (wHTH) domain [Thermoactinomyces sp. DSM 45891]
MNLSKQILIVDDDKEIVNLIDISLQNEGFTILKAYDGEEALEILQESSVHLIILDVMMPKMNGLEFCRRVRQKDNTPILMLSAKSEDTDKITGLMTGADDYMTKPFNLLEMMVRVKALLRRAYYFNHQLPQGYNEMIRLGELTIDRKTYSTFVGEEKINLTSKEFEILYLLATHLGQAFNSEEIFRSVWKEKYYEANNTVMVHISNLRDKLEKNLGYKVIHTIWGVGYKIEG